MYKIEFDKLLNSKIPQATLLYGECDFLIEFYSKKIQKKIMTLNSSVDILKLYFDSYNIKDAKEAISQQSLFSSSILLILKLTHKQVDSTGKDLENLLEILKINSQNFLIVEFYNNNDSSKYIKTAKLISKFFNTDNYKFVRFFNLKQNEAIEILSQTAIDIGVKIGNHNLLYLYHSQNNQIGLSVNEIKKFVVFDREILKDDIDKLCYGLYTNTIEELCEAILDKKDYESILLKLEEEGVSEGDIISFMQSYFYRLFLFFSYIKSHGKVDCNEILGFTLPKNIEDKYVSYAIKMNLNHYLGVFNILNNWVVSSRKGGDNNYFSNLIKIKALLK